MIALQTKHREVGIVSDKSNPYAFIMKSMPARIGIRKMSTFFNFLNYENILFIAATLDAAVWMLRNS